MLIVCCDGLTGFAEAIEATWPQATVQTCVVHLIRAAMRFSPTVTVNRSPPPQTDLPGIQRRSRTRRARRVRRLGTGPQISLGGQIVPRRLERFTPFLAFPPELRRVIYTTNSIESLNYQLRKVTKTAGTSPTTPPRVKLL